MDGKTKQNRLQNEKKMQKRQIVSIQRVDLRICVQTQTIRIMDGRMDGELGQINYDQTTEDDQSSK